MSNNDDKRFDPKQEGYGYNSEYTHNSWDPNSDKKPNAKREPEPLDEKVLKNKGYESRQESEDTAKDTNKDTAKDTGQQEDKSSAESKEPEYESELRTNNLTQQRNAREKFQEAQKNYKRFNMNVAKQKSKSNTVFAVLLAILLTAFLVGFAVWYFTKEGLIPGANKSANLNQNNVYEVEGLGLSIHSDDPEVEQEAQKLAQVVDILQNQYYSILSDKEILESMSQGVLNSLDNPYTYYMSQEEIRDFQQSIKGNYYGIGATVSKQDEGKFEITEVFEDSPAEKAGLKNGDEILEIDGTTVDNFENPSELANAVKGEEGSKVSILVSRDGDEKELEVKRGEVKQKVVRTRVLENKIGYMYITEFTESLPKQFEEGLRFLVDEGVKSIVFDLRFNPGGSAAALTDVVDMLQDEGVIADIKGRQDGKPFTETWESKDGKLVPDNMKYAILVNGSTASAAELFTGALRDNMNAHIIGSTTYGKGSGTQTFPLLDGSAANVTIFNYYLPDGDLIESEGIEPAEESEGPDIESLKEKPIYDLDKSEDPDLEKAIDYLKKAKAN